MSTLLERINAGPLDEADRDELVAYLCDSDFDYITQCDGGLELLDSYLRNGFIGYEAYTHEELIVEYLQRKEME